MAENEDSVNSIDAVMVDNLYCGRGIAKIMCEVHMSKSGEGNEQLKEQLNIKSSPILK